MTTPTTPAPAVTTPPKNGAHPAQPQQPVTPPAQSAPPPDATQAELKQWQERATKAEQLAQQKTREEIVNRRKYEGERQKFGDRLKMADEHERLLREARINKSAVARRLWGDKWQEELNTEMANGGAPSPEAILFDNEQREQRLRKEFDERERKAAEQRQEAEQRSIDARVRHFRAEVMADVKAKGAEFPLSSEQFRTPEALEAAVFNYIVNRNQETTQRDPETGEVLRAGIAMKPLEALEALEADLYAIAERAAGNEKYAGKLREKLTPPKVAGSLPPVVKSSQSLQQSQSQPSQSQQGRRTLNNDLTGSTPGDAPKYRDDKARLAAAIAAANAASGKS